MNLCVIPARGGSKRIPRKNIKTFAGKPIIHYSIEAAQRTGLFDNIIVSTDDFEIAEIARQAGAMIPFMRPAELADDFAPTVPVIKHAVDWYAEKGECFDHVCCIYATAPFVQTSFLKQAYQDLQRFDSDYCFSATPFPAPVQRGFTLTQAGQVRMLHPELYNTRSQDLEPVFHDAGQFYWGKASSFQQDMPFYSENSRTVQLPQYLVQDIDTPEDWQLAELMYRFFKQEGLLDAND